MKKNKAGFGDRVQGTGGFSVFRMRVRKASDEQKAKHNEGATGEVLAEGMCEREESRMIGKFLS